MGEDTRRLINLGAQMTERMPLHIISLGAGVQSTTMALMAAQGEIVPMPQGAIFADTGWEPKAVYKHLEWLVKELPFPVHVVTAGRSLKDDILRASNAKRARFVSVPFFTETGLGRRQCTREFKISVISKKQRELLGYLPRQRIPSKSCEVWIGISVDEAMRMKPSSNKWAVNRWPLIERRMTRNDCLRWLERNNYPLAPKSACIGCPFHSDAHWRDMRDNSPEEWAEAVAVDRALRERGPMRGTRVLQYMHRQRVPLDQVDLSTLEDHGQLNLFINECEGMCGV